MGAVPEGQPLLIFTILMKKKNIVLITGFMCAGKTTAVKTIAADLNIARIDLDHLIEQEAGMDIPSIFANEGEAGFRMREHAALLQIMSRKERMIVAGGGGLPKFEPNLALLRQARTVFLDTPWPEISHRIISSPCSRPLIYGLSPMEVECLWRERRKIYLATADHVVDNLEDLQTIIENNFNCSRSKNGKNK